MNKIKINLTCVFPLSVIFYRLVLKISTFYAILEKKDLVVLESDANFGKFSPKPLDVYRGSKVSTNLQNVIGSTSPTEQNANCRGLGEEKSSNSLTRKKHFSQETCFIIRASSFEE